MYTTRKSGASLRATSAPRPAVPAVINATRSNAILVFEKRKSKSNEVKEGLVYTSMSEPLRGRRPLSANVGYIAAIAVFEMSPNNRGYQTWRSASMMEIGYDRVGGGGMRKLIIT